MKMKLVIKNIGKLKNIKLDLNNTTDKSTFQINAVALPEDLNVIYKTLYYTSSNTEIAC